jgi:hypothetical protein
VRWDDSGDTSSWLEADKIEKVAGVVGNTCNNINNLFPSPVLPGTHFTCFTGTKVQILTQLRLLNLFVLPGKLALLVQKYLRYVYKSSNTDT